MRAYKTVNDAYIEPISFVVPRRAEVFQSDIYPPAVGTKAGVSGPEWLAGTTALPPKIDLESVYEGNAPVEVPAEYKPPVASAPAPAPAPVRAPSPVKKEPEPVPVQQRSPPPTMSQQKGSIAEMASKFQDNNEEEQEDDDDASSFEEISKPIVRPQPVAPQQQVKPASPVVSRPAQVTSAPPIKPSAAAVAAPQKQTSVPAVSASSGSSTSAIESTLDEIKRLLEQQTKTITGQTEQIGNLTTEVDTLKKKLGSGTNEQNERIRQLELELEAARS